MGVSAASATVWARDAGPEARNLPTLASWRGEGGAARCKAAGLETPEVYSLEYVEDFSGPRTTQMVADRSPQ